MTGICYLDSRQANAFPSKSTEMMGLLATGAAVAIERANMLAEMDVEKANLENTVRTRTATAQALAAKAEHAQKAQGRFLLSECDPMFLAHCCEDADWDCFVSYESRASSKSHHHTLSITKRMSDTQSPLNSVIVLSDLLLEASLEPTLYEYVSTIKESSNDLLSVIRDILVRYPSIHRVQI